MRGKEAGGPSPYYDAAGWLVDRASGHLFCECRVIRARPSASVVVQAEQSMSVNRAMWRGEASQRSRRAPWQLAGKPLVNFQLFACG